MSGHVSLSLSSLSEDGETAVTLQWHICPAAAAALAAQLGEPHRQFMSSIDQLQRIAGVVDDNAVRL